MPRSDRDYESQLIAAQAQADGNPYVAGIQEVFDPGADEFQSDALEKKLAMYSGTMPANETLNDRSRTMRG